MTHDCIIGIDFGTSNTMCCVTRSPWQRGDLPTPLQIEPGKQSPAFPTVLLHEQPASKSERFPLFGHGAFEEWITLDEADKRRYRFSANFKPDISVSSDARIDAQTLLAKIRGELFDGHRLFGRPISPDSLVVIGVPATPLRGHSQHTLEIARAAGFKNVETVDEPKAALAFHLNSGDIPPHYLKAPTLIVDFGGGTCDFAYMVRGECQFAWGNPLYGGRLFDDLFFQWFCESNNQSTAQLESEGIEAWLHWAKCREAKESFSTSMGRRRDGKCTFFDFLGKGGLRNITWEEFLKRARNYVPTEQLRKRIAEGARNDNRCFQDGSVDLVSHFETSLSQGLDVNKIQPGSIELVILTGGSSLWPFVTDALVERFHVPRERIKQAANPQETVALGVALVPAMRGYYRAEQAKLKTAIHDNRGKLKELVMKDAEQFKNRVVDKIGDRLVSEHLRPLFDNLKVRSDLWTLAQMRKEIEGQVLQFQPKAKVIAEEESLIFSAQLELHVRELLTSIYADAGLNLPPPTDSQRASIQDSLIRQERLEVLVAREIATAIAAIVAGLIVGGVCGGAGLALIMGGPIGWLIGFVLGIAAIYAMMKGRTAAELVPIPSNLRGWFLTDNVVEETRTRVKLAINEKLTVGIEAQRGEIEKRLNEGMERIVADLNWVEVFCS